MQRHSRGLVAQVVISRLLLLLLTRPAPRTGSATNMVLIC